MIFIFHIMLQMEKLEFIKMMEEKQAFLRFVESIKVFLT